jgi:hypothetical protein
VKAQAPAAACDYLMACSARVCDKYNVKALADTNNLICFFCIVLMPPERHFSTKYAAHTSAEAALARTCNTLSQQKAF